jgi:hypothetical protein
MEFSAGYRAPDESQAERSGAAPLRGRDASDRPGVIEVVRSEVDSGEIITLFDTDEAMRRGDDALNAMSPGGTERRVLVELFEVPVTTVSWRSQERRALDRGGARRRA